MTKILRVFAALAAGLLALSCNKTVETQLSLSDKVANFEASGNLEKSIKVTCNESWTVSEAADWIAVDPASYEGSGMFRITVTTNTAVAERSADVKVSAGDKTETVKVTQLGVTPSLVLSTDKADFQAEGGEANITVTANLDWTVSAPQADAWLSVAPAGDKKSFKITAQENVNVETRTSTVTVSMEGGKEAKVAVSQLGLVPVLEISPAAPAQVSREGGVVEVAVTSNVAWTLTLPEDAPWLSADPMSGEKDGTVKINVALNDADLNGRSASISIQSEAYGLSKSLTLSQEAAITSRVTDSLALVKIYVASDGANWAKNNWELDKDISTWNGVTLTGGRVTALKLTTAGTIVADWTLPEEVGDLTELTELRVNGNKLTGALPASLFELSKLQKLYFQNNNLTGELSAKIGQLTELTEIYIDRNTNLGGNLEWIGNLTKLVSINIAKTSIGGAIPASLVNCKALKNFMAYENKLSGEIPDIWDQLTTVGVLQLYDNPGITGPLPSSIGSLVSATGIQLKNCNITGNIPASFGGLTKCGNLQLNGNKMSGVVPAEVQAHPKWLPDSGWKYETNILPQQEGYGLLLKSGSGGQDLDDPVETDPWN